MGREKRKLNFLVWGHSLTIGAAENGVDLSGGNTTLQRSDDNMAETKTQAASENESPLVRGASAALTPSFLFDLDGTLVDSVYQHVLAWREALEQTGIQLAVWRIHRRIGMSGGLFVNALLR